MPGGSIAAPRAGRLGLLAALALAWCLHRSYRIDYDYSIDFQAYWLGASRVAHGEAESLYRPGGGPAAGLPLELEAYEFKNVPLVALALSPLARLDYASAKRVFWWIGLASLAAAAAVTGHFVLPASAGPAAARVLACLTLLLVLAPAHTSLRHGQTTPLVTLLVAGHLGASRHRREALSGALLALACLVKLPLLALVALAAARRRWRSVLASSLTLGALLSLSLVLYGAPLHRQYLEGLRLHAGTVMTGHNNQSLRAVLYRFTGDAPVNDWTPRPLPAPVRAASVALTLAGAAALALVLLARRASGGDEARPLLEHLGVLAFALVALPLAWDHYFLLLAPGLAALAATTATGRESTLLLASALLLVALPTPQWALDHAAALGVAGAAILSHYFLGAALVVVLSIRGLWLAGPEPAR